MALVVAVTGSAAPAGASIPVQAGESSGDVDLTIEVGLEGVVPELPRIPIRVLLSSPRSRSVSVIVSTSLGSQRYEVELNAGAATATDVVMQTPLEGLEVEVRDPGGARLARKRSVPKVDDSAVLVGVGASLAPSKKSWSSPTIGDVQDATLLPLSDALLDRAGVLDALSGIILGPGDVERLSDRQTNRLSRWVAAGGNLALDQTRTDPLPVLGVPAEPGNRTAVEAGWVRFTGGDAAAGKWSQTVEPAVSIDEQWVSPDLQFGGFGDVNFFNEQLRYTRFLKISYLPSWVIIVSVFVTALLVGPLLWFLLRSRSRRRWMWLLAPTISVVIAVALVSVGQGALSDAQTTAAGNALSTKWGTVADLGFGTKAGDGPIELGTDGQVWAALPTAPMSGSGDERSAAQKQASNGFGFAGVGLVPLSDEALVEVEAVAQRDGTAMVAVTNNGESTLTDVTVGGFGRTRDFDEVPAGATRKLPFEVSKNLDVFAPVFPPDQQGRFGCFGDGNCFGSGQAGFGRAGFPAGSSRGQIEITGRLVESMDAAGERRPTNLIVVARTTITADESAPNAGPNATMRIETVGFNPGSPSQQTVTEFDGPVIEGGEVATTVVGSVEEPGDDVEATFVRLSTPVDRMGLQCAVHTSVGGVARWTGTTWADLDPLGEAFANQRFGTVNEMRNYPLGDVRAGDTVYLRLKSGLTASPAQVFDCGEPTS